MNKDLEKARLVLSQEGCTCVVCKGDICYKSNHRGVAPLMEWLEAGVDATGFSAADKVVGKATAFLYCLLGVRAVHAKVISEGAITVLRQQGICASWDLKVPAIQNRAGNGLCPMELATRDISDPADAPAAIREALARLTEKR